MREVNRAEIKLQTDKWTRLQTRERKLRKEDGKEWKRESSLERVKEAKLVLQQGQGQGLSLKEKSSNFDCPSLG
jgi:hypothetical protein